MPNYNDPITKKSNYQSSNLTQARGELIRNKNLAIEQCHAHKSGFSKTFRLEDIPRSLLHKVYVEFFLLLSSWTAISHR